MLLYGFVVFFFACLYVRIVVKRVCTIVYRLGEREYENLFVSAFQSKNKERFSNGNKNNKVLI